MVTIDYRVTPQDRSEAEAALSQVAWPNRPIEVPSPVGRWVMRSGVLVGIAALAYYLCKRNGIDLAAVAADYARRNPVVAGWTALGLAGVILLWVIVRVAVNLNTRAIHSKITIDAAGVVDEPAPDELLRRGPAKRR